MPKKVSLFNDESDEEKADFKINEDYAKNYDRWRRSEELSKLKAQGITEEDSSSDSSDEDDDGKNLAKPVNPEFDREFLLSLGTLYKIGKGEKVKVENVQFFKGDYRVETEKKERPLTLKDLERQVILEREGKYEDDEDDSTNRGYNVQDAKKISFDDGLDDSEDDDGDGLLNSGLFKVKEQSDSGTKEEKNNATGTKAVDFVKGLTSSLPDSEDKDILESVKSAWTDKKLPKKEKWLVDFFLNQRYLEDDTGEGSTYNDKFLEEEELSDECESEEDNPLAAQHKYRHQEPGDILKRHPRHISDTLRPKDEKRKEKREAAKERKLAKKEEKRQEIEMLKALKYKEIEEKIDRIREASGNEEIDLGAVDLDEEFDPAEHDKYMEQMFGEDYYDPTNVEQELPEFEEEEDDTKTYDNWTRPSTSHTGGDYEQEEEAFTEDNEMGDYNEFQQFEESEIKEDKKTTRRKGRRHRSKFARAVEKEKPAFDPKEKDFASYFDEYYQLDFEDVVGGIPCRFKYRNVEPNSFGLTTGEILAAQNSDLNKWVGLKKILKYNRTKEEELKDRVYYDNRSLYEHVKRRVMPSLFSESQEELANQEREKRRLKNLKRKQKRWLLVQGHAEMPENMEVSEEKPTNVNGKRPREDDHEVALQSSSATSNEEVVRIKKKKKKNKKETNMEVISGNDENDSINEMMQTSVTDCLENTTLADDADPKIKKKKKKRKVAADVTENTSSINESLELETKDSKIHVEKSHSTVLHKKKKHSEKADNAANNITKKGKIKMKMSRKSNGKKKDHNRNHDKATEYFKGISDARLEAYGQNPKKLKNRIKYGKDV